MTGASVRGFLSWIYSSTANQKARESGSDVVFPVSSVVPVLRGFGLVIFGGMTLFLAREPNGMFGAIVCLIFACISLLCRSIPIVIAQAGISGPTAFSTRRFMPWSDVSEVEFKVANRVYAVRSRGAATIYHSGFHFDPARFEKEVKDHTGLKIKVIQPGVVRSTVSYR
jgi:hypothetical protein